MLLSMVSAPSATRRIGTLGDEATRRRFNVATSRARDQMILFHSATLNDLGPQCFRAELLRYCQSPSVQPIAANDDLMQTIMGVARSTDRSRTPPPDPFESWFEVDVFLRIASRGFRVLPQYEVAGYRIDLVVDGISRRLAVECDGDRWHGPERYEEDMARQRVLERCGWRFWRVRGSAFALDPDTALAGLWSMLESEGIAVRALDGSSENEGEEGKERVAGNGSGDGIPAPAGVMEGNGGGLEGPPEATEGAASGELVTGVVKGGARREAASASVESEHKRPPGRVVGSSGGMQLELPDPTTVPVGDLVPGVVEVVDREGPVCLARLQRVVVKASGRHRVGRNLRSAINKAVWRAIREGRLEERKEIVAGGVVEHVDSACIVPASGGAEAWRSGMSWRFRRQKLQRSSIRFVEGNRTCRAARCSVKFSGFTIRRD